MSANAPQAPQQASVSFDQLAARNPARWNSLNADDKRALAAAAYDFKGIKTIGDAAMEMDRQTFINKASQFTLPDSNLATDLASVSAGQTFLNEVMNQFSWGTTDLPANYNGFVNAAAGFSGRVLAGGLQDYAAGAAGAALGAGIGSLVPGIGTALGAGIGYGVGQFGSGAAQGYSDAIDRYQDVGRPIGLREQLGAGAEALGYGALNLIPGVGQIDTGVKGLLRAGARNGLVQGLGTGIVDATGQAITDGKVDWQRAGTAAAIGFGGGLAGTAAHATIPAAKRYYQGVRKLTQTAKSMMQVQAAPIGLRGLNAMPDANLSTSAIIPEGQGAGAYSGDIPSELQYYGIDPNDRPPNGGGDGNPPGGGDDNGGGGGGGGGRPVEDQNTQNLRRLADIAVQRAAGGDYKPVQKAQEYIAQVEQAGVKIPDDIKQRINQTIEGDPQKLDEIASKVYYMAKRGQKNEAKARYVAPLPPVQKGRVVDRIDALAKVEKDYENSIKSQEKARIGKKREEADYAKLQEKQASIEKKQKERLASFELSRDPAELDSIAHALVDERKAAGKNQANVDLKKAAETEGLTTKDQAYIKDQITKIEAANRKAEARAYRATNKETPVPKDADKQLLALAKDDATQYASLMVDANGDKPAIDLLEQLGYKIDLADDGYGHKKSRRVFLGGRAGTVKFEVGDSLKAFGARVSANGGTLQTYIASKMVKLSQETGAPVHRIAGETLGDAIEAIDNDIIAGESQAAVDALAANAQIEADFEVAARDEAAGAYYEEVDAAYNAIKDRLLAAKTPEEAHAAFDYMEQRLEPLQTKEQELLIKGLDEEYTYAAKIARKQIEMEQAIDAAIDKKELVTLHGTAFEQVGDTLNYNEGIKGGTNKSLGKRTQETVVDKGVSTYFINNKPESFLYIRTIDNQGQLRTRYVYNSPKGSKIDSIELSGEPSPYRYERVEIEGRMTDIVVGPNGVVPQKRANASMVTSQLEETVDLVKFFAENSDSVTVDDIQRLGASINASGIDKSYLKGSIENMSDEGRRAAFKDMTGGDC